MQTQETNEGLCGLHDSVCCTVVYKNEAEEALRSSIYDFSSIVSDLSDLSWRSSLSSGEARHDQ